MPEPARFESWLVGQVRAGKYGHLKYFNINNRHYNQKADWKPVYSSDSRLHMSFDPGAEYADSSILADYERWRTGKPAPAPRPPAASKPPAKLSQLSLPVLRKGASGAWVGTLKAALVAHGYSLKLDDAFGPRTYAAVRSFQTKKKIGIDGVVGDQTWGKLLAGRVLIRRGPSP
ncbi:peptidoglycan-binding domain-containing protein [Micromonospora chersina]|uniref:peptidoglycan-binding domain-containing protein n=1 Tax=Micromonospora chersina TaxID=47854 RepID=UPI0033BBB677